MIDYTIEEGDYDALIFRDERRFVKAVVGLSQDEEGNMNPTSDTKTGISQA